MILACCSMGLSSALAQDAAFDAHGFPLAPQDGDPRAPLVVQRPSAFRAGDAFVGGLFEYARVDATAGADEATVLRDLVALNLSAGVAVHDRWRVDLRTPVFWPASGDAQTSAPTFGDLRLTSMWSLVRPERSTVGLGVVGHVDAPTGAEARYLGQPGWAGGGRLALSVGGGPVSLAADAGVHLRSPRSGDGPRPSDQLLAGAALSFGLGEYVGLVVEATTATDFDRLSGDQTAEITAEGLAALRVAPRRGPFLTVGAAAGIAPGRGTPRYRTFLGFGFARRRAPGPPDTDPILPLQSHDLCPNEVETSNGWRDDDGCPDRLGTLAVDVQFAGESRPANSVITGPNVRREQRIGPQGLSLDVLPGTEWLVEATEGCLEGEARAVAREDGATLVVELSPVYDAEVDLQVLDDAGNPIPGAQVGWRSETPDCVPLQPVALDEAGRIRQPLASGLHTVVISAPRFNVYDQLVSVLPGDEIELAVVLEPARVFVDGSEIRVLDKVRFASGRAALLEASLPILDEVAALLLANPGLRVEVGGHTDARGSEELNQQLSQARATRVEEVLVERGVDADRLVARGYGEEQPVASNRTEEGRDANRRVTFRLVEGGAE